MSKGRVKYFNDTKGWGFLSSDDVEQDVYVHYTQIKMEGYKTLKEGQDVTFELTQLDKGFKAQNVNLL